MVVLLTGASGFVGAHLRKRLQNHPLVKTLIATSPNDQYNPCDIANPSDIKALITKFKPDVVFHLAAQSNVAESFKNPNSTIHVNFLGTLNLLEAIKQSAHKSCFIYISTGEVYGETLNFEKPTTELARLQPINPYATSKAAADILVGQYGVSSSNIKTIRLRPFNHFGPGQSSSFVIPAFLNQLHFIKKNKSEPIIKVGDLSPKRDFLDVRDIINGYLIIFDNLDRIKSGDIFNLCSGRSISIQDVLDILIKKMNVNVEVVKDPDRFRPSEIPDVFASNEKIKKLGWEPQHSIEQSIDHLIQSLP